MFTVKFTTRSGSGPIVHHECVNVTSITDNDGPLGTVRVLRIANGLIISGARVSEILEWEVSGCEPHVLYSPTESALHDGAGFWNIDLGWVRSEDATVFCTPCYVQDFESPCTGNDRRFESVDALESSFTLPGAVKRLRFSDRWSVQHEFDDHPTWIVKDSEEDVAIELPPSIAWEKRLDVAYRLAHVLGDSGRELTKADLATLRAALHHYEVSGLSQSHGRSPDVQELATDCGALEAHGAVGIETLDEKLAQLLRLPL